MPTVVHLASIGSSGFLIQGAAAGAYAGYSISSAGDINGDGFDDIVIGSPYLNNGAGSAYLIYGHASGFGTIDLAHLSGGFAIQAPYLYDGASVSRAGDVNGDGFDDFIVTSSFSGMLGYGDAPKVYVIFGGSTRTTPLDLSHLSTADGFVATGPFEGAYYRGFSVATSSAGDVNGDGFDDVIIGMRYAGGGFATGKAWVLFGKSNGFGTNGSIDLSNLPASDGFVMNGEGNSHAGGSVTGLGDINGDGFDDIAVGEPVVGGGGAGKVFVVFGKASGFSTINLGDLGDAQEGVGGFGFGGFVISGASPGDAAGLSVSAAGDVNGDGIGDILVGAPNSDNGAGRAYVIFGQSFATLGWLNTLSLTQLQPSQGFIIQGGPSDDAGSSVAAAGDVNHDGYADVIIGAPQFLAGPSSGHSYVIFGHGGSFDTISLANLAPNAGFSIQGIATGERSGLTVSGAGDFNGDGFSDVLVGAQYASPAGSSSGQVGLVFGSSALAPHAVNDFNGDHISDLMWRDSNGMMSEWLGTPSGGFRWNPSAAATAGSDWTMLGFGDFNLDGRQDILWRQSGTGTVQEWLGRSDGSFAWNRDWALPTTQHFQTLGDFNGDGREDIIWRSDDGTLQEWLGQANGGFGWTPFGSFQVGNDWAVIGAGDFNKDGHDDLLWRQGSSGMVMEWLGNAQGGFAWNTNIALPTNFHLVGTGDFNGDGATDLLWQNDAGTLSEWLAQGNGGFQWNANAGFTIPTDWKPAGIGDFNGDGFDDIMWQTSSGHVYQWLGQPQGSTSTFVWNQAVQYDVGAFHYAQPAAELL